MWEKLGQDIDRCTTAQRGQTMSKATTLAATALQLSEVANRQGSPEHDSLKVLLTTLVRAGGEEVRLTVGSVRDVPVPDLVVDLLKQISAVLDRGDGVIMSEVARELTTSEAARVLGVSRPTLTNLLEKGEIRFSRVGTHRRVALQDVLAYRRRRVAQQRAAYEALMAEQDEFGISE